MMKKIQVASAVALALSSVSFAQQAVQWKVSDGGNGHWYQFLSGSSACFPWWRGSAESSGAYLASIGSVSEQAFLVGLLPEASGGFVGGTRSPASDINSGWMWVNGEPFSWTAVSWAPGNPGCCAPGEYWLVLLNNGLHDGAECGTAAFFEWSADCNNDGIVDYGQCRDGSLPDYNGNNIPDCCEAGTPCVVGNYPVQWRVADGGNGHWYFRLDAPLTTWSDCRTDAISKGADLVSISSADEYQAAIRVVTQEVRDSPPDQLWMGASSPIGNSGTSGWSWADGTPWQFAAWCEFSPNNGGGQARYLIHYTAFGCWDDYLDRDACCHMRGAIIEWSADCNGDGIVDKGQILRGQLPDIDNDGIPDSCEQPTCRNADLLADRNVDGIDLGILLGQWGPNTQYTISDINSDGVVDGSDLGLLLSFWGPCPY
jgi:hypothetical protein